MEVLEILRARRSVRSYSDEPIEEEKLLRLLEAARIAPSAKNMQEWKFVVVRDEDTRNKLIGACCGQRFVGQAPVVIACCGTVSDYTMTCGQYAYPIDVSIAIDHIVAQATAEGLGTCWIGAFYEDHVKKLLSIPPEIRVVQMLAVGYPKKPLEAVRASEKKRKSLEEVVCWEQWR